MRKLGELCQKYEEIIRYVVVGGLTTIVSLGSKYLLLFTFFNASVAIELQLAIVISWICAVSFAYIANRIFVFKSKSKQIFKELVRFFESRIVTLLMEMAFLWFFVTFLGLNTDVWVVVWTFATQLLVMVGNYVLSRLFVFKNN